MTRDRLHPWLPVAAIVAALTTSLLAADEPPKDAPKPKAESAKPKEIEDFAKAAEAVVLHESANRLEGLQREALENVHALCGLRMPEGKKISVSLNAGGSAAAALTFVQPNGALITFNAAVMKRYNRDYKEVFKHEIFHAVQDCWWGVGHGPKVPSWIKEGLATYCGGNGPGRVKSFMGKPNVLDGLLRHSMRSSDYAEDYLAILYIEKKWGGDGLKTFVREVTIEKTPWEAALKKVTDLEFREFAERAKKFSIEQLTVDEKEKEK